MATPVFCCGFECGVDNAHWTDTLSSFANWEFSTSTVRNGSRSLRVNPSGGTADINMASTFTTSSHAVIRYYVRFATLPNTSIFLNVARSGGTVLSAGAYFNSSDSKIYARASATSGATGVTVTTGVWYRIDVKLNLSANPWLVDVEVDGTACGQASSAVATATFVTIALMDGGSTGFTGDLFFDDFIVSITAADYPLGAGYVNHFTPTADGTHNVAGANDFERSATGTDITNATTDAYTLINDIPLKSGNVTEFINCIAPPNSTDYVAIQHGPAPGISTPTAGPRAVEHVVAVAKNTGTGSNALTCALYHSGTFVGGAAFAGNVTATSPTAMYGTAQANRNASNAVWTATNFNSELFMRISTSDAAPDPWVASSMIEAEFSGDPPAPPTSTVKQLSLLGVG